jgi:hypothetical protein
MDSTLLPVMVMIIESGAVYSAALISIIAAYALGNNSQYIIVDFVRSDLPLLRVFVLNRIALFIQQLPSLIVSLMAFFSNASVSIKL